MLLAGRAVAQLAAMRKIGILSLDRPPSAEEWARNPLIGRLKELGWVEGKNLTVVRAYADRKRDRLAALAEELVRERVEVIWTEGSPAPVAARATRTIPIVFYGAAWPVEMGLIDSFARPGRNVTGVSFYTGIEVSAKRLEFLREIAPDAKRLSWILAPDIAGTVDGKGLDLSALVDPAARKLGYEVRYHEVRAPEDVEKALAEVLDWRAQTLSVSGGTPIYVTRQRISDFALRHRLPSASAFAPFTEAGGLLSYSATGLLTTLVAQSADYVDKILRGARPADLPVDRPSRYELVINLKTARALGLKVPQTLLLRADRLIE
jgi:putative ABC transport system substrate-binding protein